MTDVLIFVRGDDVRTPEDIAEETAERIIDAGFDGVFPGRCTRLFGAFPY